MSSPSPSSRLRPAALATVFVLFAALLMLTPPAGAAASGDTSGKAVFTLGAGKAGKALARQWVHLKRVAPAESKADATGRQIRLTLPVGSMKLGATPVIGLRGGYVFSTSSRRGRQKLKVSRVAVSINGKTVKVTARAAGRKLTLFTGKGVVSTATGTRTVVKARVRNLDLTPAAARLAKKKLRLRGRIPAGKVGGLKLNASKPATTPGESDPYLTQCGIAATSKVNGGLTPATPLPVMTGAKPLSGAPDIAWGFRASFRGYMGSSGTIHAVDGAGRDSASPMAGFTFPVKDGLYKANDPVDTSDDQAVINGKGTAVFCNPGHGFRIAISNPTIVIDGASSRIIADVDTNYFGIWTPAQRINLADLDLNGISPFFNRSGSEVTWQEIPAVLTAAGGQSFCEPPSEDRPGQCLYHEGDELDPVTAGVHTAYDTGTGDAASWDALATYTKTQLPFPLGNPAAGGCSIPDFAGGTLAAARTIDEYLHLNGNLETPVDPPEYNWTADGARPAALPDMTGGVPLSGGQLDWGVLRGIRSSASGTGEFNLSGGATASTTYYGNGPGASEATRPGYGQKMGAPNAYFTWPASTIAGAYRQTGSTRQLVLRSTGRVAICNTAVNPPIGYGTVISNPTVVINGANSRITADVATRYRLSWVRGTVDVARFNAADAVFSEDTADGVTTVRWALPPLGPAPAYVSSASMTTAGVTVLRMLNKNYADGSYMDPPTVSASFPSGG